MLAPSTNKALEVPPSFQDNQLIDNPSPPYYVDYKDPATIGAEYEKTLFARCARGDHQVERKYGIVGILAAAVFFPVGLICLFLDSHKRCSRCGVVLPC